MVREPVLKVECWSKVPCCTRELNLRQHRTDPILDQLSYIPIAISSIAPCRNTCHSASLRMLHLVVVIPVPMKKSLLCKMESEGFWSVVAFCSGSPFKNNIPPHIQHCSSLSQFRICLKTLLYIFACSELLPPLPSLLPLSPQHGKLPVHFLLFDGLQSLHWWFVKEKERERNYVAICNLCIFVMFDIQAIRPPPSSH